MEVVPLVELLKMKNGMEIIVHSTSVTTRQVFTQTWYLVCVTGAFKRKHSTSFEIARFTIPIIQDSIDSEKCYWSLYGEPGNTISFFDTYNEPSEGGRLLHYCLSNKDVLSQLKRDFGDDSWIVHWVENGCMVCFGDSSEKKW